MVHKKKKKTPVLPLPQETIKNEQGNLNSFTRDKRARIIIRNLPFANLSEDSVRKLFAEYGNIIDVNLLKKPNGKFVGCGFIEYDSRQSAAKAIVHVNGKDMSGRTVVVDWALPKNTFIDKANEINTLNNVKKEEEEEESDEDEANNTVDYSIDKKPNKKFSVKEDPDDDDDDEDEDDFDDDDEEEEEYENEKPRVQSNDVEEGKTVFIKNVPFSANNDDLKKVVESYGPVVYALICVDKMTEHSKGSAFVKFKEKESADKCIKDSQNIIIKDQALEVTQAVSRSKLEEEKKLKKLKNKDSRNLYLVREGVVMAGSPAALTVSAADMAKRLQIEQWKTQILRNLNMFVSRTRVVVHNLPPNFNDSKLRETIVKYSKPGAVVKEARVMQDRKKFDGQGQPLSKEVGFVTFTSHEDALYTLRQINNNPDVFIPSKRPIVSFSIENRQILNMKQKRLEKSRAKIMGDKASKDKTLEKMNKKQRRFLKRKEKIIRERQEAKRVKRECGSAEEKKPVKGKKNNSGAQKVKKETPQAAQNGKKSPKKRKATEEAQNFSKKPRLVESSDNYSGVQSLPGKKLKMRSKLKLSRQAEIHKQRLKEVKKIKKAKKVVKEKKQILRQKEPAVKKKTNKKNFDNDGKFTKLINSYKSKIENAASFKKWYET